MKLIIVYITLLLLTSLQAISQEEDPTMKGFIKGVKRNFPITRTFDLQYDQFGPTNYNSKLLGQEDEKGRFDNHNRLKIAVNLPLYKSKSQRFVLTNTFLYKYESYGFGDIYNFKSNTTHSRPTKDFHYFAEALSATYVSSLFNKPIIYNATMIVDGNEDNVQRIKGFVTASLVLKKTANTTITAGLLVIADPSSIVPIAPLFTYNHQFVNSKWEVGIILPKSILFRRELLENGRISFGTEFDSENFYLNIKESQLKGVYEVNSLELKSGITYEYHLDRKIIGTFKTGINNILSTRVTERGERTDKYIYENKQDAQAYFRLGLSYNPF
ncbi:hypothetical protein LNQ49_01670 [Flavobacterium sp. F-65]|uniref:Outer membrane protein beta-barrel domain-containing protein n=1 Tax=Flavobacterium pisciphilum TaxID=2893755 RepID=A0ABS8MNG9_9FLAO|nr:hypothetical protein [Flavobacterium sp. F-65]MCC9070310.1 hypothetical protein [Flavobacterium sp. F-65]